MWPIRETLDGLRKVGFKLNSGIKDTGILLLLKQKGGGHYFGTPFKASWMHKIDTNSN